MSWPRTELGAVEQTAVDAVRRCAHVLQRAPSDLDPLLDRIGDARFVLLGEATHGTHEFYRVRAEITRRLIEEKSFTAVAVEADWPDAYRVNRWVRAASDDASAEQALSAFKRFPILMWRNADVLDLVGWLREYNEAQPVKTRRAGIYGLDLYALYTSIAAVVEYLESVDPALAERARARYSCFEHFGDDSREHNSHLGDARATEMGERGEWNVGQLVRERFGGDAVLVGFTTYTGTVTAASNWDAPAERKRVRPALPGSYEALLHETELPRFLLRLEDQDARLALAGPLLERAIGVIYRPETERASHYFRARLPDQFDAVFHYDHTRAVEPLEKGSPWREGDVPETWPEGI